MACHAPGDQDVEAPPAAHDMKTSAAMLRVFIGWLQSPRRFRWEKWFWGFMTIAVVPLALLASMLWNKVSIVYVAAISGYALYATFAGAEQGSKAKENTNTTVDVDVDVEVKQKDC